MVFINPQSSLNSVGVGRLIGHGRIFPFFFSGKKGISEKSGYVWKPKPWTKLGR